MNVLDVIEKSHFSVGHVGAIVTVAYFLVFIVVATMRGNVTMQRDVSGTYRLSSLTNSMLKALKIPLLLTALGFIAALGRATDCVDHLYDSHDDAFVVGCDAVVTYDAPSNINWIGTAYNGFGDVTIQIQLYVAYAVFALVLGMLAWALFICLRVGWMALLKPTLKLIERTLRRIPVRW
ncbi:MAG: hypothetical protein KBC02_01425 [Candidatus Pacebacteria bacterium]|nr:hypothetical protein [Candidatus Paceibacterota bacterium]